MCEQVDSISKTRIGDFMCTLTPEELAAVDKALAISFNLAEPSDSSDTYDEEYDEDETDYTATIIRLEAERDCYKEMLNNLLMKGAN